jgi:hypothetical protein
MNLVRVEAIPALIQSPAFLASIREPDFGKVFLEVSDTQDIRTIQDICTRIGEMLHEAQLERYRIIISLQHVRIENHERFFVHFGMRNIDVTKLSFESYVAQEERLATA